jgi:diketogulonate reductase-like aldo/keto reductase
MPFSLRENELRENLTVGSWRLDEADMKLIASLDRGHHYLDPINWCAPLAARRLPLHAHPLHL